MNEEPCPLITTYTDQFGVPHKVLELLYRVRRHDFEEGPIPIQMPSTIRELTKTHGKPFALRNFQTQMAAHLIKMPRFINGDGVGLGKTATAIVAAAYLKEKHENKLKIIVFGTKSTTYQWKDEGFDEFTTLRTHVMTDTYDKLKGAEARLQQVRDFLDGDKWDVLICKYTSMIGKRKLLEGDFDVSGYPIEKGQREEMSEDMREFLKIVHPHGDNIILICDECQKFKGTTSQARMLVWHLSKHVGRVWAMTATVIQNSIDEFYAIASAIGIRAFGSMVKFKENFCRYKMIHVGRGQERPKLIGYQNVRDFKIGMRPFYYGRSQAQVKEQLPRLTTQYRPIDMDARQEKLYNDIRTGKFQLPPSVKKIAGEFVEKERDPSNQMTMLAIMQQIANHPCLVLPEGDKGIKTASLSPKEEALLDLLDNQLAGEKVLVFAQPLDAKILTPHGWKLMGELKVGDVLVDPDGGHSEVEAIFPKGIQETYRVTMKSGASTEVTGDHLWLVQTETYRHKTEGWRLQTTSDILRGYARKMGPDPCYTAFLPLTTPVEFESPDPVLPPYLLGVLLGAGSVSGGSVSFTSEDADLLKRARLELPAGVSINRHSQMTYGLSASVGSETTEEEWVHSGINPVTTTLQELNVMGKSNRRRHIPPQFKEAPFSARVALLQGVLDTAGHYTKDGFVTLHVTSRQLAEDAVELTRSLGGIATTPRLRGNWGTNLRLPFNPFFIQRKASLWEEPSLANPIRKIVPCRKVQCQCIRVSSKRNLYVTDDYIVTHNTKSKKWIDRFEWLCENGHFTGRKFLRITGNESEAERAKNKRLFQTDDDYDLMFINTAIMEGANLQQSAHMILLDAPWGWGALIQLVGRMVRMYSPHLTNTLHVFVGKGTIDEYTIDTLKGKKGVFEKILGESHSTGLLDAGLDAGADLDLAAGMETLNDDKEFKELLTAHLKSTVMRDYLSGDLMKEAKEEDYVMSFEKEPKRSNRPKKFEFSDRW